MTPLSELMNAHPVIGRRWARGPSPAELRLLALARDVLDFISATGQRYRFEDFSGRDSAAVEQPATGSADVSTLLSETERFFVALLGEPASTGEQAQIQAILSALRFIASTGQHEAFRAYLKHVELNAPPFIVAAFNTWDEAERWLKSHPRPPAPANILIANSYHDVVYDRETDIRRMPRNRALHEYLAELTQVEPPVAAASFATREEAEAWLKGQAEPACRQWFSIAGELYLAAYYPNLHHQALFPLALARSREGQ